MKLILRVFAALMLATIGVSTPALAFAGDKPLVIESAKIKQLPAATTLQINASGTGAASINIPHGTAPTSPTNGDCWTTTAGLFCRINSATVGPYSTGGGAITAKDEGSTLTSATTSVDFVGAGVTATNSGGAVTVTIPSSGGIASGTSFPGSPATNDRFYRTDRRIEYFYDGTRWLTTQLFYQSAVLANAIQYTATAFNQQRIGIPKHGHTDVYVEYISLAYILVSTGNWTVTYNWSANSATGGTLGSGITVATIVTGNHYYNETAIGSVLASISDIDFTFTENSGVATFFPMPGITYRLVG